MRPLALRQLLLVMLAGIAGPGCAKEDLLMHKVDVHEVFADDRIAEMADAIAEDDAERVRALARTTDLTVRGDKNVTLLEWAVFNQSKRAFNALLEAGTDPTLPGMEDSTVGHLAAMANDPYYLGALLKAGLDPSTQDKETRQPLLSAALTAGRDEQIDSLLAAGANPNSADQTGNRPLHAAAKANDYSSVMKLLEAGADPNAVNAANATFQKYLFMGDTRTLTKEARDGRTAIESWLRSHGIDVMPHD